MHSYSKLEIGTIASVLAGAVWIGTLQGSVSTLDTSAIRKEKDSALEEINSALKVIERKNKELDNQYKTKVSSFEKSLDTINEKLRELDVLIVDFQNINNEDNRAILAQKRIIKLEENIELITEEVNNRNNNFMELEKSFKIGTTSPQVYSEIIQAKLELDKSIEKLQGRENELIKIKGDNVSIKTNVTRNLDATAKTGNSTNLYKINIKTDPLDAKVRILNLNTEYEKGMVFPPGLYKVSVSKFKYATKVVDIDVVDHDINIIEKLTKVYYPLYIDTNPRDAKVKITSNKQKYERGMYVEPGNYRVKVSRFGYVAKTDWVSVEDGTTRVSFKLNKKN